jgi:hypothetical protein
MKKYFLIILVILPVKGFSQYRIEGNIIINNNKPVIRVHYRILFLKLIISKNL